MRKQFPILLLLLLLGISSCKKDTIQPKETEKEWKIEIEPNQIEMEVGALRQLSIYLIQGSKRQKLSPKEVKWESQSEAIIKVVDGKVQAIAEGESILTAKYKEKETSANIIVTLGKGPDLEAEPGMPFLKFGASSEEIKSLEIERGNTPFLSGKVNGEEGMTYVSIIGKKIDTHKFYEYFFENDRMSEVQTYTTYYEEFWTLEGNGKPTQKALDYFARLGFKFYGWDNEVGFPTCVCWSKYRHLMLTFGPRYRQGKTFLMFNIFPSEEPIVEDNSEEPIKAKAAITMHTTLTAGSTFQIGITSTSDFKIDFGDNQLHSYPAGNYEIDKMIKGSLASNQVKIYGEGISQLFLPAQKITQLSVKNCPKLRELRAIGNQLSDIDLSQNPHLEFANLSSNNLSSLDVSRNPQLKELHCYKNQLTSLLLPRTGNMILLYAYKNKLRQLNLDGQDLQYLNITDNQISQLDLSRQSKLIELQAAKNQLTTIYWAEKTYQYLLAIFLQNNQLPTSTLQTLISLLPDVNSLTVKEDETKWKKVLNILNNPGSPQVDLSAAREKGWKC